jgi:hypothetical protein
MNGSIFCRLVSLLLGMLLLVSCTMRGAPPAAFQEIDLVGIWEARYSPERIDRLEIRDNGTFKQTYLDRTGPDDYVYETPWNHWSLERLPDGRVIVHLQGARYYLAGKELGELDGLTALTMNDTVAEKKWFYDPFGKELIHMVKELTLNVRDVRGELILHHVWTSGDGGFALFGGDVQTFRKLENP